MSNEETRKPTGKAKGGVARAKSLTKEQRTEIAKKAAAKRWEGKPLRAIRKGNFIDDFGIDAECYVLDDNDKTVVVSKTGLSKLLGIGEHGRDVDRFLNTNYMADFVDPLLLEKFQKPLIFQWRSPVPNSAPNPLADEAHGYDIALIGDIATAMINADRAGALPPSRSKSASLAQRLVTASMKAGLKGLGYAIAGYRPEVQEVIDSFKAYVREEARQYEKEFPDELYEAWYKIYQLNKPERGRPFLFSKLTIEQIYTPLAKSQGVILDLAKKSRDENGKRGDKIHQFLQEVGVRALRQQIGKVLAVSELFEEKDTYEAALAKVNK
ncbi:TPA: hypothetical protein G8V61_004365 [Salmonella enterica]|nr:hypothetical protein [Salmonella enterica]